MSDLTAREELDSFGKTADEFFGKEEDSTPEEIESVEADSAKIAAALGEGGRAAITVRSKKTGEHVSIRLTAKKKKPGGRGWVSRASHEGRVGKDDADAIFADDSSLEWPDGRIGYLDLRTGEWKPAEGADAARVWAAEKALSWALGRYDLSEKAEVFVELRCSYCGHPLRDPVSIERGVGPDCWGRRTGSKSVSRS